MHRQPQAHDPAQRRSAHRRVRRVRQRAVARVDRGLELLDQVARVGRRLAALRVAVPAHRGGGVLVDAARGVVDRHDDHRLDLPVHRQALRRLIDLPFGAGRRRVEDVLPVVQVEHRITALRVALVVRRQPDLHAARADEALRQRLQALDGAGAAQRDRRARRVERARDAHLVRHQLDRAVAAGLPARVAFALAGALDAELVGHGAARRHALEVRGDAVPAVAAQPGGRRDQRACPAQRRGAATHAHHVASRIEAAGGDLVAQVDVEDDPRRGEGARRDQHRRHQQQQRGNEADKHGRGACRRAAGGNDNGAREARRGGGVRHVEPTR